MFKLSRIRRGEWIMGVASLALLVILFAVPWFGFPAAYSHAAAALGAPYNFSGWESMSVIRFLVLAVAAGGVLTWYLQGRMLAPAVPVCATIVETALGIVTVVALYYRVLINQPPVHLVQDKPAAFVGLALAIAIVVGGYLSMREDGAPALGSVDAIETLSLSPRPDAG